jgi:adenylate cyclase
MNLYILNGPEIGRSIEVKEGVSVLGRSRDSDINISDQTVSRKHLRISIKGDRYFIIDLKTQNGTYYGGKYLIPGEEVEIVEGAPIAIGMTVICLGESCRDKMAPYLDTITLIRAKELGGGFEDRRKRTYLKRGDLIKVVTRTLKDDLPLTQMLGEVLGHIFHHLKRIDRGAFVLVDPGSVKQKTAIYKLNKSGEDSKTTYSEKVVDLVLEKGFPVVFSKSYVEDRNGAVDTLKILKIKSVICLPLKGGSGVLGAMYLDSLNRPDGFRKDDILDLLNIAQRIALTVESDRFAADVVEAAKSLAGDDKPWRKETKRKK